MAWKLFLDDERYPVEDGWTICRNVSEALTVCELMGLPVYMSLDHDLGEQSGTGYDFIKQLIEYMQDHDLRFPTGFSYYVHSQNPIGAANITGLMTQAIEFLRSIN